MFLVKEYHCPKHHSMMSFKCAWITCETILYYVAYLLAYQSFCFLHLSTSLPLLRISLKARKRRRKRRKTSEIECTQNLKVAIGCEFVKYTQKVEPCFFCKTNEIRDLTFSSAVIAWEGGGGVQVEQQQLINYAINFSSIAMTAKQYEYLYWQIINNNSTGRGESRKQFEKINRNV